MSSLYQRSEIVLGKENIEKIKNSNICICGIGGVGSYVLEAIARIGVANITVIDKDIVDKTNINRQLVATNSTVGMDKVKVAKEHVLDINKEANIKEIKQNITSGNIYELLGKEKYDYIVDCVDNFDAKIAIIGYCNSENIKCISCMGMANKLNPLDIKVSDINKTSMCPLAKNVRKKLKELGIKKQKVVYSIEAPKKLSEEEKEIYGNTLGSVSFVPSVAGLIIASEVIKDIIK